MKKSVALFISTFLTIVTCSSAFAQFEEFATELDASSIPADQDPAIIESDTIIVENDPVPSGGFQTAPMVRGSIPTSQFNNVQHGIQFESTGGLSAGLKILQVEPMSLAQRNGLESGDVILAVNGRSVSSQADFENALRSSRTATSWIPVTVLNVRTGNDQSIKYELISDAGSYQSNFGRLDLTQQPTNNPGVSLLEGTLRFYDGKTSQIKGTLSGNTFRGTSTSPSRAPAPFELTKVGNLFEGTVTQGRPLRFILVKRN